MRKTEEILRSLLHQKGMDSQEDISEFLSDRPQKTYDPFLLYNMEAGVDLLLSEIKKDTKVCIYGDYDADGVTSVCILSSVLSQPDKQLHPLYPLSYQKKGTDSTKEPCKSWQNKALV